MLEQSELPYISLVDLAASIETGEMSPVTATEAMLDRIAKVDPQIDSYLSVTADSALAEARQAKSEIDAGRYRGPLHGVPIAIKDIFHTAGVASTFGSIAYKDFVSNHDATLVHRFKLAGAVILGRLGLHEGAFGEHHPDLPRVGNPWNKDYWPGGSSSGSGAAPAAGLCYAALGTDTGGSIRFPSASNNITGLKPTWGRTSRYGVFALSDSLDTIGPMARSAADVAAMFDAMAGHDPNDPTSLAAPVPAYLGGLNGILGARGLRIGLDEAFISTGVDAETVAAIMAVIETFKDLGATIVPIHMPPTAQVAKAQTIIMESECAAFHETVYKANKPAFGPKLTGAIERGLTYNSLAIARAYIERDRFKGALAGAFAGLDIIVAPVLPTPGIRYDAMDEFVDKMDSSLSFSSPFNVSGSPSLTMPCGIAKVGMPIGVQLIGPHLTEDVLLRAGHAFQQATAFHLARPNLG